MFNQIQIKIKQGLSIYINLIIIKNNNKTIKILHQQKTIKKVGKIMHIIEVDLLQINKKKIIKIHIL